MPCQTTNRASRICRPTTKASVFFLLSKTLGALLEPVDFIVLVGLAGLALCLGRFRRLGRIVAVTAALALAVCCFSPLGSLALRPLEDRFPRPAADMPAPTGIVVLGGSINEGISAARGQPTIPEAAARLTAGVALARRYPEARLVFTGGASDVAGRDLDEARGVRDLWLSLGVPESRMTFESASRNTRENATLTLDLIKPKPGERWLLVTSAAHMPRSMGIFRSVGWPMIAYPVDYQTYGDRRDFHPSIAAVAALHKIDTAVHEWTGLLVYRLTGRTNALFPRP